MPEGLDEALRPDDRGRHTGTRYVAGRDLGAGGERRASKERARTADAPCPHHEEGAQARIQARAAPSRAPLLGRVAAPARPRAASARHRRSRPRRVAVFLVFPLWLGWEAGAAGEAITNGLRRVVGEVAYAVPVVLAVIGALVVLRPVLPAVRPLRAGALCLFGAVDARAGRRHVRPRSRRRAPGLVERPLDGGARRRRRRDPALRQHEGHRERRRAHPRRLPLRRGGASCSPAPRSPGSSGRRTPA